MLVSGSSPTDYSISKSILGLNGTKNFTLVKMNLPSLFIKEFPN